MVQSQPHENDVLVLSEHKMVPNGKCVNVSHLEALHEKKTIRFIFLL